MTFLITGGAGFIGSNLAEVLSKDNDVLVLDNLHTGSLENLKGLNLKTITRPCKDIPTLSLPKLDGIFHLGIPSSSPMYKNNPLVMGDAINEFILVLETAKSNNCPLVYASSSSVYNGNSHPWSEGMPVKVSDYYAEARYSMERLAQLYFNLYNVPSIGLRFFSVYGPKEEFKKQYANLVSQFLWSMNRDISPVIYGDGLQRRDFTHVSDIVEGCCLAKKKLDKKPICGIFNLGTGKNYDLNELIKILNKTLDKNIKPTYIQNPIKNYVRDTLADTTKAKRELGFVAKIGLEEGIRKLAKTN